MYCLFMGKLAETTQAPGRHDEARRVRRRGAEGRGPEGPAWAESSLYDRYYNIL